MKAMVVTDSVSKAAGGLLDAERSLHQRLCRLGVETSVFSLEDAQTAEELPRWEPIVPRTFPPAGPASLGISGAMRRAILTEKADLVYRVGLWRLPSNYAHRWSSGQRKPEIIAPHGMLDPWAVTNSRWKKRLAHLWFEGAHLRDASCIRALCESEVNSIRAYGLKNPVCVIPNGIDLPGEVSKGRKRDNRKILLFLGRLHPKKGLVNALRAWGKILGKESVGKSLEDWQFVIAGWEQGGHRVELEKLCQEIGISVSSVSAEQYLSEGSKNRTTVTPASVVFVGPAFGEQKEELLRCASAFILPSFSEGLPMSVLEAWSYAVPVLMTDHCNIPEGFVADAAIRIGTDVDSIADRLSDLFQSSDSDLQSLGQNGRDLVERQFTWGQVAAQMKDVYEWILGGGQKPGCVRS